MFERAIIVEYNNLTDMKARAYSLILDSFLKCNYKIESNLLILDITIGN
jgi:hypothetical protein